MPAATEFYTVAKGLQVVLWIEAIVYLGIGIYELFDDFIEKGSTMDEHQWPRERLCQSKPQSISHGQYCNKCGGHLLISHPDFGMFDVFAATIPTLKFDPEWTLRTTSTTGSAQISVRISSLR